MSYVFNLTNISIAELTRSPALQSRVMVNDRIISEYQAIWESGLEKFPPIAVFFDGKQNWVADGFHRLLALEKANLDTPKRDRQILANIIPGSFEEAILHSLGANTRHGLRPTNQDKRRAVLNYWAIGQPYCCHSNNMVAAACGVSHTFVANMKATVVATDVHNLACDLGFDPELLSSTIANLKAAGDTIVTQRDGKELVQSKRSPQSGTAPQTQYVSLGSADNNPISRHQIVSGVPSLANPGFLVVDGGQLLPESDAIAIPYQIGSLVATLDDPARQLIVDKYHLVGTDLKAICHGVNSGSMATESIDHLQPYAPTPMDVRIAAADRVETDAYNLKKGLKELKETAIILQNNTSTDPKSIPVEHWSLNWIRKMSLADLSRLKIDIDTEIERRTAEDIPNPSIT